jgi:hypothetical protein
VGSELLELERLVREDDVRLPDEERLLLDDELVRFVDEDPLRLRLLLPPPDDPPPLRAVAMRLDEDPPCPPLCSSSSSFESSFLATAAAAGTATPRAAPVTIFFLVDVPSVASLSTSPIRNLLRLRR